MLLKVGDQQFLPQMFAVLMDNKLFSAGSETVHPRCGDALLLADQLLGPEHYGQPLNWAKI